MATPINIGDRFGRLTIVERAGSSASGEIRWTLQCDCGGTKTTGASYLRRGITRSCGCFQREGVAERFRKHGGKGTVEHNAWAAIIQRCTNPKHPAWCNYGGRGITICAEWRHDFAAFLAHVGLRPSDQHSIDRIDNNRGYEPGNVRWATRSVQQSNIRPRSRDAEGRFA